MDLFWTEDNMESGNSAVNECRERPAVSIVIPCYNEEECFDALYSRVSAAAAGVAGDHYEIVLVNDGSRDRTWTLMQQAATGDCHVVAVNLSRNHGHQLALTAGLSMCRGHRIFIIDADLQDPPELLGPMMSKMDQGFDVVYGKRRARAGETLFKQASAALFYRALAKLAEIDIPTDTGDFRLMSRRAVEALMSMPETHRFVRGMVGWIGFPQTELLYDRAKRYAGETKYPIGKMMKLAIDAITGFSTRPLRLASHLGFWMGLSGVALLAYVLLMWTRGQVVPGWASIMIGVTVVGSLQLIVLGVIGEYLGRLYMEAKRRPTFLIQDIVTANPMDETRVAHVGGFFAVQPATEARSRSPSSQPTGPIH